MITTAIVGDSEKRWRPLQGLSLLLPVFLLFHGLTTFGLLSNVEGMYAEIAREMLVSSRWQDWVIPHLNGLPYIEKPPLNYWLMALSMGAFGVGDTAVRLVPTGAALVSLGTLLWYGQRLHGPRYGALAAFVLGTSAGQIFLCKVAMIDPLLSACFNAALLTSHVAWVEGRARMSVWTGVWLALAVMTKGFVALALFFGIWAVYGLCCERGKLARLAAFLAAPRAWLVFLLLAAPWHLLAAWLLPEFAWFYFINEHVLRFLGMREPRDFYTGSVFYYVPRLLLMFFPWTLMMLLALVQHRPLADEAARTRAFLIVCVLVPFGFFSASAAKANYYLVVCLPALALLAALYFEHQLSRDDTPWLMSVTTLTGMLSWALLLLRIWMDRNAVTLTWLPFVSEDRFYLSIAFVGITTTGIMAALWRRNVLAVLLLGGLMVPVCLYLDGSAAQVDGRISARSMAAEVRSRHDDLPVFLYQDYENYSGLAFYLQRAVGVVDTRSQDLEFGLKLNRPADRYPTLEAFLARPDPALLVVLDNRVRNGLPAELALRLTFLVRVGNAVLYRFTPA